MSMNISNDYEYKLNNYLQILKVG